MPTTQQTIHVHLTPQQAVRLLSRLPAILTGSRGAPSTAMANTVKVRVGLAILDFVHKAYLAKMDGGADASGLRWFPLSPVTLRIRQHKMTPRRTRKERADRDRQLWKEIYRGLIAAGSTPASAAIAAWRTLAKRRSQEAKSGAASRTRILVETGKLEQSLFPGARPEQATPTPPRVPLQVFRVRKDRIEIGTRRPHALDHHEGRPLRKPPLPQRRLWPAPAGWPTAWWDEILNQLRAGVMKMIAELLAKNP